MTLDAHYHYETPENVEVAFDLAGPGSRMCALVIDWLLIWLSLFIVVMGLMAFGVIADVSRADAFDSGSIAVAILVLVVFLVTSGYFIFFEAVMRGQTPGKRSMKLRVIHDDATGLTLTGNVIRNLLRIVDFLPGMYLLGGAMCLMHPQHKRLGDLAAGTIVVKEAELDYRARADQKGTFAAEPVTTANVELTPAERRLISGFLGRRSELLPEARDALAQRLAEPLYRKYGGVPDEWEFYLERLLEGRHHER